MRYAKCCWASCPQGCRFPKEDPRMGDSLWLTSGAAALHCLIKVYTPDNDVDFSTLSTTDDFSKWWSAFWNFSVIFRKLYLSRTVRNFPHGDLAVFTVLLPASSFSSLLFSFLSFFFLLFFSRITKTINAVGECLLIRECDRGFTRREQQKLCVPQTNKTMNSKCVSIYQRKRSMNNSYFL